ncbi:MAG: efflux RND transporter periplasmic adaptor subunit, partial [Oleibacter sp.]|nr:efflux RND transporter periplasmic adaptor subunit [Thalassolituus sp.]
MINSAPASRLLAHRVLSLSFITAVVVTLVGCSQEQENNQSQPQMPPPAVEVVTLSSERLELVDTLPGRVSAYRTAEIRPQVSGIILKRFFEEGATVKKGDKLYQIDPTLYASELASAEAQLAVANANAYSAKLRDERYQKLSQSAISAQEITDADAAAKQTAAQVKAAEANVQRAKVNLGYTKITAPIDGVIGRSTITEGALVSAQQALPLTMIQQLSPIYVDIKRPAAALLRMGEAGLSNKVKVSLDDGTEFDEVGERQFSDAMVDEG